MTNLTEQGRILQQNDQAAEERRAEKIRVYWAERGYDVTVEIVDQGWINDAYRATMLGLRSNTKNGFPTRRLVSVRG